LILKNIVTLKSRSGVTEGHRKYRYHLTACICGSLFVSKIDRFFNIHLRKMLKLWNPGLGSINVLGNDNIWQTADDFIFTF